MPPVSIIVVKSGALMKNSTSIRVLLELTVVWRAHVRRLIGLVGEGSLVQYSARGHLPIAGWEPGRPKYPEFSWDFLRYYLDYARAN